MSSLNNKEFLKQVLEHLNPDLPAGSEDRSGVTKYQERAGDLLRRLSLEIESRPGKARVLVTGQIGVGKSSELIHFFHTRGGMSDPGRWIFCNLEKEEHPERCGATGVFLTIFRDCWGATKNLQDQLGKYRNDEREYLQLRDEILNRLIDWLKGEKFEDENKVVFRFGNMDFPIFLQEKNKALALVLGKAAQHEAVSQRTDRFGIVPDSLINLLNKLLRWIRKVCRDRYPVLLVDHVDKIRDSTAAGEVLKESVPHWQQIEASIVMTAPYEYTLGEMRHSVESYWGKPIMIYPLDIPELEDESIPPFYNEICNSCGLSELITEESIRWLARYSGGIPRTFVLFLIDSCKEAYMAEHKRIEISDAQMVIYRAEQAYQDYGPLEMSLLNQITHDNIGLNQAATLLQSPIGLLVCTPERGEQPLRVHPLAEKMLERYRLRLEKKAV